MRIKLVVSFDTPEIFEHDDFGRKTFADTLASRIGEYLVNQRALNITIEGCDLDPDVIEKLIRRKGEKI